MDDATRKANEILAAHGREILLIAEAAEDLESDAGCPPEDIETLHDIVREALVPLMRS